MCGLDRICKVALGPRLDVKRAGDRPSVPSWMGSTGQGMRGQPGGSTSVRGFDSFCVLPDEGVQGGKPEAGSV